MQKPGDKYIFVYTSDHPPGVAWEQALKLKLNL
jgi:hypothetical protein